MKTSKYSDSLIMSILKQAEAGAPVPNLCREHGMSSATFYKWKSKYGGMDLSMMTRLKELEAEMLVLNVCMPMSDSKQISFRMHCQKSFKANAT